MKKKIKNFILLFVKIIFYRKCSIQYLNRYTLRTLLLMGFIQRVLGVNKNCPWPVHWAALVGCPENIIRTGETSSPGRMPGQYIQAINGIEIGHNLRMAPGVKIISANHDLYDFDKHRPAEKIVIGNNCWLGANSVILPSVHLANHIIVAAGSVVTKSFTESDIIIAGVPARKVKKISKYHTS